MSIICGICRDGLLLMQKKKIIPQLEDTSNQPDSDFPEVPVSTICGHLFHEKCLLNWFSVEIDSSGGPWKSCPYCKKVLNSPNHKDSGFHKIFPVFGEHEEEAGDEDESVLELCNYYPAGNEIEGKLKLAIENLKMVNLSQSEGIERLNKEFAKVQVIVKNQSETMTNLIEILQQYENGQTIGTLRSLGTNPLELDDPSIHAKKPPQTTIIPDDTTTKCAKSVTSVNPMDNDQDNTAGFELIQNLSSQTPSQNAPLLPPKYFANRTQKAPPASAKRETEFKLGDRVLYRSGSVFAGPLPYSGTIKTLHLNRYGRKIAGVEFEKKIPHGMSGLFFVRQYLDSRPKHGRLIEESRLIKIDP